MMKKGLIIIVMVFVSSAIFAQAERKYVRKGNNDFEEKNYTDSEIAYRKAIEEKPDYFDGQFNIGDALYKQEKYEEAAKKFNELSKQDASKDKLAKVYHNLGNSLLKGGKLKESIEAYKQSLKYNPNDIETKHNLTYALRKLKQQQQQQKNKQNQKQNQQDKKDQNKQQDQKDQNKDQNNQQQQQQQKNKQDQDQQKQKQQQQQQGKKPEISKEDAKRLLQALENDEKQLQKKLKKKKAAKTQNAETTKNW